MIQKNGFLIMIATTEHDTKCISHTIIRTVWLIHETKSRAPKLAVARETSRRSHRQYQQHWSLLHETNSTGDLICKHSSHYQARSAVFREPSRHQWWHCVVEVPLDSILIAVLQMRMHNERTYHQKHSSGRNATLPSQHSFSQKNILQYEY